MGHTPIANDVYESKGSVLLFGHENRKLDFDDKIYITPSDWQNFYMKSSTADAPLQFWSKSTFPVSFRTEEDEDKTFYFATSTWFERNFLSGWTDMRALYCADDLTCIEIDMKTFDSGNYTVIDSLKLPENPATAVRKL